MALVLSFLLTLEGLGAGMMKEEGVGGGGARKCERASSTLASVPRLRAAYTACALWTQQDLAFSAPWGGHHTGLGADYQRALQCVRRARWAADSLAGELPSRESWLLWALFLHLQSQLLVLEGV